MRSKLKRYLCAATVCAMLLCIFPTAYAADTVQSLFVTLAADTGNVHVSGVHPLGENMRVSVSVAVDGELFYRRELAAQVGGEFAVEYTMDYGTEQSAGDKSGKYTVTVGGAGLTAVQTTYPFVNKKDGVAIVAAANGAGTATAMKSVVSTYADACGFDLTPAGDFYTLSPAGKTAVYTALAARCDYTLTTQFIEAFNKAKAVLNLNEGTAANAETLVSTYKSVIGLNTGATSYYAKLKTAAGRARACAAIVGKDFLPTDTSAVVQAFEKAVLTELINETDTSNRSSLITYIEAINAQDGNISTANYNSTYLTDTDRADILTAMAQAVQSAPFADASEVKTKFEALCAAKVEAAQNPPAQVVGGGGGGKTSRVSIGTDKATVTDTAQTPTETAFSDVSATHWAAEAVNALCARGIVNGTGNGTFAPDAQIKREEFVKLIVCALDLPAEQTEKAFDDVPDDAWYYPYVMQAYALNVVQGIDFDTFGTGESITREQMCTVIYRAMKLKDINIDTNDAQLNFADGEEIATYAQDAIAALYRGGVINGVGNNCIAPRDMATRAQAAKMLYMLMKKGGLL